MPLAALFVPGLALAHGSEDPARGPREQPVVEGFRAAIPKERSHSVTELHAKWLAIRAGKSAAVILDARTEEEWDLGHIEGAERVDFDHAHTVAARWPDANTELWVHCRLSKRSIYLAALLQEFGYRNVHVVSGGFAAWKMQGYPAVTKAFGQVLPKPRAGETLPVEE